MLSFRVSQWHSDSTGALFFPVCVAWHQLPVGLSLPCIGMPLKACLPWLQLSAPFWLAFSAAWKEEERENHVPSQARPETDIPVGGKGK